MPKTSALGVWLAFVAAVYFAVFLFKGVFAAPPAHVAGPFDADRAFARLSRILGDERPHPVDSAANDAVRDRLVAEMKGVGLTPEIRDDFSCRAAARWGALTCARVRNVVSKLDSASGEGAILVASHYDSVAAGPGASDDGAGVAASLEIAALLKGRVLGRPVIFLFSDGEEAGLLGAASFVRHDPYANQVTAVVNLEARGVSGRALMFETAYPNRASIEAYAHGAAPAANSLDAAVYKLLPNDTDFSELSRLGAADGVNEGAVKGGVNIAYTDGLAFYHTPHDNLRALDRRSLAHMGASAFSAVEGFLASPPQQNAAGDEAYVDIFGEKLLRFPLVLGFVGLGAAFVVALSIFVRVGGGAPMRAVFAPPAAMLLAGLVAFLGVHGASWLRGGEPFWFGSPLAARALIYTAALASVIIMVLTLARSVRKERLIASAWLCYSAASFLLAAKIPGAVGLAAPPAFVFVVSGGVGLLAPGLFPPLSAFAAVVTLALFAPALADAEIGLGLGAGAPFACLAALLFFMAAPLAPRPEGPQARRLLRAALAPLVVATLAALVAPAYTPRAPRPLNIVQYRDGGAGKDYWVLPGGPPPPRTFAARFPFSRGGVAGVDGEVYFAPAAPFAAPALTATAETRSVSENAWKLRLRLDAEHADVVTAIFPAAAGVTTIEAAGVRLAVKPGAPAFVRCTGRTCAHFELDAALGEKPAAVDFYAFENGLDPAGEALAAARPATATCIHGGDGRRLWLRRQF